MTGGWRGLARVAAAAAVAGTSHGLLAAPGRQAQQPQTPQPVFRMTADAISVHVAVRDGNRPVANLPVEAFELLDNGVPQQVRLVSLEEVPLDITVVVDTSGSISGRALQQLQRDTAELTRLLRPADRLRALTFATAVSEMRPMQESAGDATVAPAETAGSTAFFNALIAALARPADGDRPHVVVALSDGGDNVSLLDGHDVRDVARHADAVLHVVLRGTPFPGTRGWMPFNGPGGPRPLREAAELTGGSVTTHRPTASVRDLFTRVIDEFRTGYVLWFTPTGVEPSGWHDLTVRVKTSDDYTVTARRGYTGGGQ